MQQQNFPIVVEQPRHSIFFAGPKPEILTLGRFEMSCIAQAQTVRALGNIAHEFLRKSTVSDISLVYCRPGSGKFLDAASDAQLTSQIMEYLRVKLGLIIFNQLPLDNRLLDLTPEQQKFEHLYFAILATGIVKSIYVLPCTHSNDIQVIRETKYCKRACVRRVELDPSEISEAQNFGI